LTSDCCADLDARVAELEATTARKGNRRVSLTISGWVARELYVWDDGKLSDAYVVDTSVTLATHFKFSGEAQIKPGWKAGFVQHIELIDSGSIAVSQLQDEGAGDSALYILEAKWFIESDRLGRITVGQQSQPSDNTAILADFSGSLVQSNWVLFDGASFFLRPKGSHALEVLPGSFELGNTWGSGLGFCATTGLGIGGDCNGLPRDAVRYDTPSFYGLVLSTSWGENDYWDIALNYQADWNSVRFKLGMAYNWWGDNKQDPLEFNRDADGSYFQIGAMALHVPSGLFLYGAYGKEDVNNRFYVSSTPVDEFIDGATVTLFDLQRAPDNDHWFFKAGIRRQWNPLGATVFYGEWARYNDMFGGYDCTYSVPGTPIGDGCDTGGGIVITASQLDRYGFGVVQEIDAAAMSIWAKWVQLEGDIDFRNVGEFDTAGYESKGRSRTQDYERLNQFLVGALINFQAGQRSNPQGPRSSGPFLICAARPLA
jgi:hypothetical protein